MTARGARHRRGLGACPERIPSLAVTCGHCACVAARSCSLCTQAARCREDVGRCAGINSRTSVSGSQTRPYSGVKCRPTIWSSGWQCTKVWDGIEQVGEGAALTRSRRPCPAPRQRAGRRLRGRLDELRQLQWHSLARTRPASCDHACGVDQAHHGEPTNRDVRNLVLSPGLVGRQQSTELQAVQPRVRGQQRAA